MPRAAGRLRVVVLIDVVAEIGGAEALAVELLARLDPAAFVRTLVVYRRLAPDTREARSQQAVIARLRAEGVEVLELEGSSRFDLASWRPFARLLRSGAVDVLHSHLHGPNLWAALWTRAVGRGVAFIAHEHTWSFEGRPVRKGVDRWVIATATDVFFAVSEHDRRRMLEAERIPPSAVRVLANGIATPAPARRDARRRLGVPDGAPLVAAVGLLRPQKDYATLLRAHRLVLEAHPAARLVIAGDGDERDRLRALVDELGLGRRVLLPGFVSDTAELVSACDVAVNSSTFEGSSLALMEFMALGRPIVATAVGGTPAVLGDGACGVLVPPRDPAALGAAVAGLLTDPARARALGDAARRRQRAEYDIDEQVARLAATYREVATGRRGRGLVASPVGSTDVAARA